MSQIIESLTRLAANIAEDSRRVLAASVAGDRIKSNAGEIERRLAICRYCLYHDADSGRCLHPDCGCFMAVKTRFKPLKCPIGKW